MQAPVEVDVLDAHIRLQHHTSLRPYVHYRGVISDAEPETAHFARNLFAEPTHELCFAAEFVR